MKTYREKLDEMTDAVIKLVWNYTIFCGLFEKIGSAEHDAKAAEARLAHQEFFIAMEASLLGSFFVVADLLFHEDKYAKATSLCNLIRDLAVRKPGVAKKLGDKIHAKRNLIERGGVLRNQFWAHRWEAKTPQAVFSEAGVKLSMMKEIADLAQAVIVELAGEEDALLKENLERHQLSQSTLQCVAQDAQWVLNMFGKTVS